MKFTLSWLKDYLDTDATLDDITEKLTALGLEVEGVEDASLALQDFVVGAVIDAKPHPDADRLQVCTVDTGSEQMQVVCGAPNARAGIRAVFAPSGTTVPGTGFQLKKAVIRGVESNGMMCSEKEIGISDEHGAIIELSTEAQAGDAVASWLGLDDPMIEIAITPNRQDCLGVMGIARDLAAAGLGTFRAPQVEPVKGAFQSPVGIQLELGDAPEACPLFLGRYIKGVKNGPSPEWLQRRLKAIGLRPISALVDITNYLSYDQARPLHVYDADRLSGDIIVRLSKQGETMKALDGEDYTLTGQETMIADEARALGLGGVMGGEDSGSELDTVNVFLEAAYFDPIRTAHTGRRLGIDSDARYRFERGVDPAATMMGIEKATQMIVEFCGGEVSDTVQAGAVPDTTNMLTLRTNRVKALGGMDVPKDEMLRILAALGFEPQDKGDLISVSVPSWRPDVHGEADLVEEVMRVYGYDKIETEALPVDDTRYEPALAPSMVRARALKRALAARGLTEAVTWSFANSGQSRHFGEVTDAMYLANPISSELDVMRPSILPGLVDAVGRNVDRGIDSPSLFEVGPIFHGGQPGEQQLVATGVRQGRTGPRHWSGKPQPVSVFDAKADALAALQAAGAPANVQVSDQAPAWYHPGRSGSLMLGPKKRLASFGELHPAVLKAMDVAGPIAAFEIYLDEIPAARRKGTARPALAASDLQAVERDLAFVVDNGVTAGAIISAAQSAEKQLLESVSVFDVFEGEALGAGKKSLAITVRLQPREKTLTDEEIDAVMSRIIEAVAAKTGGALRA
jgi:phenylalanyl-tRNA synthetase beta chain